MSTRWWTARSPGLLALAATLGLVPWCPWLPRAETADLRPVESDAVERAEVSLTLIDVRVQASDGSPIRGLTAGDFEVRLNRTPWPVYSVDNLCDCVGLAAPASATMASDPDPPRPAGSGESVIDEAPPEQAVRYVSGRDTPLFKFGDPEVESGGACSRLVDVVESWRLVEGDYRYHIRWGRPDDDEALPAP